MATLHRRLLLSSIAAGLLVAATVPIAGAAPPGSATARMYQLQGTFYNQSWQYPSLGGTVTVTDVLRGGRICYKIALAGFGELAANGESVSSVVVTDQSGFSADLGVPGKSGTLAGCLSGIDATLPLRMATHPSHFVVIVSGSISGEIMEAVLLHTVPTIALGLTQFVCPTIHDAAEFAAIGAAACQFVTLRGTWSPDPAYTYPTFGGFMNFDFQVVPPITPTQTLSVDAQPYGGFVSDETYVAYGQMGYQFTDVGSGRISVSQAGYPAGFACGAAVVTSDGPTGPVTLASTYVAGKLAFDTTGYEFVEANVYAFAPGGSATC